MSSRVQPSADGETPSLLNEIVAHRRDGVPAVRVGNNDRISERASHRGSNHLRTARRRPSSFASNNLDHLTRPQAPTIIHRMSLRKLLSPQVVIGFLVTVVGLVAFNLTRPGLQSERQAAFDTWYSSTVPSLEVGTDAALANRKLTVKVRMTGALGSTPVSEWTLPIQNLGNAEDRTRTARVLQLISESQVFGLPPAKDPSDSAGYLFLSIADGEQHFDTVVALQDVEKDIRLQNLIKLLEVFSSQPPTPAIDPTRL